MDGIFTTETPHPKGARPRKTQKPTGTMEDTERKNNFLSSQGERVFSASGLHPCFILSSSPGFLRLDLVQSLLQCTQLELISESLEVLDQFGRDGILFLHLGDLTEFCSFFKLGQSVGREMDL